MEFNKILAISGVSGLHRVVAQTKNGVIVESIADGKRFAVQSNGKVSALADINMYGNSGEVPLKEIFININKRENGAATSVSSKGADNELRAYFKEVFADYDEERVYTSDIKKVLTWYNLLQSKNLLSILDEKEAGENDKVELANEKPVKQPTAKAPKTSAPKASSKGMAKTQTVRKTGG